MKTKVDMNNKEGRKENDLIRTDLLDTTVKITKLHINCKYCDEEVEGWSDSECILEMIYHVHEKHIGINR